MEVLEGSGWRLAVDRNRTPFPVLVGGDGWASELSTAEAQALARAASTLQEEHRALMDRLMPEEAITLEREGPVGDPPQGGELWLELEGDRRCWSLRFVLSPGAGHRALEGSWRAESATAFVAALTSHPEISPS